MKKYIKFEKVWEDESIFELKVEVKNSNSKHSIKVYTQNSDFVEMFKEINYFKDHVDGSVCDLKFGEFGSEYANGCFRARLHKYKSKIYVTVKLENEYNDFGKKKVVDKAEIHLVTEQYFLDEFVKRFERLNGEIGSEAILECVDFYAW